MAMKRFRDKSTVGSSAIVPFLKDESAQDRHARRLHANLEQRAAFSARLSVAGFEVSIKNDGHHWTMSGAGNVWEWWPSSAKLVKNRQYRNGKHCHDYEQVLKMLGI